MANKGSGYSGNKGLEYYKAYPRDFFEGSVGLDGPIRGFYRMVIDLIYMHDGFLLDDWGHISGNTGFSQIKCKRMMDTLIAKRKIHVLQEKEKFFTQKRTEIELKDSRKFQEKQSKNIAERWKNNGLDDQVVKPPQDHKTTRQEKEPKGSQKNTTSIFTKDKPKPEKKSPPKKINHDIQKAYDAYNLMAEQSGLPIAQKLSDPRKSGIAARLKDAGGIEGWQVALEKVAGSPYCTGQVNGWKADLDFIIKPSKFISIMEGKYDGQGNFNAGQANGGIGIGTAQAAAAVAQRIISGQGQGDGFDF